MDVPDGFSRGLYSVIVGTATSLTTVQGFPPTGLSVIRNIDSGALGSNGLGIFAPQRLSCTLPDPGFQVGGDCGLPAGPDITATIMAKAVMPSKYGTSNCQKSGSSKQGKNPTRCNRMKALRFGQASLTRMVLVISIQHWRYPFESIREALTRVWVICTRV